MNDAAVFSRQRHLSHSKQTPEQIESDGESSGGEEEVARIVAARRRRLRVRKRQRERMPPQSLLYAETYLGFRAIGESRYARKGGIELGFDQSHLEPHARSVLEEN
jgi:hypothetical protein